MRRVADLPSDFVIRGGRVIDPANGIDSIGDVVVVDGRIASTCRAGHALRIAEKGGHGPPYKLPADPATTIDAVGLLVCPGLIDMHVHLREPGGEDRETIETGTRAAAAGGFTSLACMPNTSPAIDNPSLFEFVRHRAETAGYCRVYPIPAITLGRCGQQAVDMGALTQCGATAFSDDGDGVEDDEVMRTALQLAQRAGALVIQHCELKSLSAGGVMHQGAVSQRLGLPGIDPAAEEAMIERDVQLVRETGARYHVAHISTARAVELVRSVKAEGLHVTTEVCIHHLVLSDEACGNKDPNTKMHPPLRSKSDVQACIDGLRDGTIDCIVTDHAPHTLEEKNKGFREAPFGIVGLESALALAVKALVLSDLMDWSGLIRRMSTTPASVLGIDGGTLTPGGPADITLIDPSVTWTINPAEFQSKGRNTPFGAWQVCGRPVTTIVSGCLTYRHHSVEKRFRLG